MKSFLCVWTQQNYALTLADKLRPLPASKRGLSDASWITYCPLSINHVYTTKTLGKELKKKQRTPCKGFTNKNFKYIPVH